MAQQLTANPAFLLPIQGGPQFVQQPLPTIPAPTIADTSGLQGRAAALKGLQSGILGTPSYGLGGGIAKVLASLLSAWGERQAEDKLQDTKQTNAKALAALLSNGGTSDPNTAAALIDSDNAGAQELGLKLLEAQQHQSLRPLTPQEIQQYNLPSGFQGQIDPLTGKITPLNIPQAKAPTTRQVIQGGNIVTQQWDPSSNQWVTVSKGPRWNPKQQSSQDTSAGASPWELP